MVFIKQVGNSDSGDSQHFGGNDLDKLDKYFDNVDISPSAAIINTSTTFRDGKLLVRNAANTFSYTLKSGTLAGNTEVSLPNVAGGNITLIASGADNDWTSIQTFRDGNIKIRNPANTFGYTFRTSSIIANREITFPLLTGNDTITLNDSSATLANKTINIDTNALKHSTVNGQGDLYKYDQTAGKVIRMAKGASGYVLKVVAGGGDIAWEAESGVGSTNSLYDNLQSSNGFKYGLWTGQSATAGYGLLSDIANIGGSPIKYIDTTNGFTGLSWAMTSGTANCGFKNTAVCTMRKLNPDLTVCFQLDEGGDNTGSRCWVGFTGDLSETAADSNYLDADVGICLSKGSSDNFFKITSNDGGSTQTSTASILTSDDGVHTIRIYATEASSKFSCSLDGAAAVDVSTEIPGASDTLGVIVAGSQNDSNSRNWRPFWSKLKMKERV